MNVVVKNLDKFYGLRNFAVPDHSDESFKTQKKTQCFSLGFLCLLWKNHKKTHMENILATVKRLPSFRFEE